MPTAADTATPYLATREEINGRLAEYINRAKNWRLAFFMAMLAVIISNTGTVYVSQQQKVVPYIVSDDTAKVLKVSTVHDPEIIKIQLKDFIRDLRMLTTDEVARAEQRDIAYGRCLSRAQKYLKQYDQEHPVAEAMKYGGVYPTSIVVWPATETSPKSWRARWKEKVIDDNGVRSEVAFEAELRLVFVLPTTAEEREKSPLGIWIEEIIITPST